MAKFTFDIVGENGEDSGEQLHVEARNYFEANKIAQNTKSLKPGEWVDNWSEDEPDLPEGDVSSLYRR